MDKKELVKICEKKVLLYWLYVHILLPQLQ